MRLCPLRLDVDPLPAQIVNPSLEVVRDHCSIDTEDMDINLDIYLHSAIDGAETFMQRTVVARSHRWVLRDFPSGDIRLPRGRTIAVSEVRYRAGGQAHSLFGPSSGSPGGDDYQEDLENVSGGVIRPPRGGSWPSADYDEIAPVEILFEAGWAPADIPDDIIHGILLRMPEAVDIRSRVDAASMKIDSTILDPSNSVLSRWCLYRIY